MPGVPVNLYGKRFGRWTAIQPLYKDKWNNWMWLCRCDCGREKNIKASNLRRGVTKSCGCLLKEIVSKDEANTRIGKLTLLERIRENHQTHYRCRCDCGNEITVSLGSLINRKRNPNTNCGCERGGYKWRKNRVY